MNHRAHRARPIKTEADHRAGLKQVDRLDVMVITHGHVVLTLWHWHGHAEGLTSQA